MDSTRASWLLQRQGSAVPVPVQKRVDYSGTNDPVYYGWALSGAAESDLVWTIEYLEYDASGNYIKSTFAQWVAWTNRAGATYA